MLRDLEDLVELVAHEDHGDTAGLEAADDPEEPLHLAVREGGGRFVHDEHACLADEGAADGDELAIGDGEVLDVGVEIEAQSQVGHDALGGRADAPAGGELTATGELGEHGDVLGGREVREEGEVLVDHLDTRADGVARRDVAVRDPVDDDLARIGPLDSADDLDERRFAAAVLAGEAVDLSGDEVERDAPERPHPSVRLDDVPHVERRLLRTHVSTLSLRGPGRGAATMRDAAGPGPSRVDQKSYSATFDMSTATPASPAKTLS